MFPLFVWSVFSLVTLTAAVKFIIIGLGLTMALGNAIAIAAGLYMTIFIAVYTKAIIEG